MVAQVALDVADDAFARHLRFQNGCFGHAAARRVDRFDPPFRIRHGTQRTLDQSRARAPKIMTPIDRPFDFRGATALVVGGASGLGRAMAESLAQHGASVCIAARTEEKARTIAADISARAGGRCESCAVDLAAEASVQALGATVDRLFGGRLNIAVNSRGHERQEPHRGDLARRVERHPAREQHRRVPLAREMYPRLKAAGWGRLIHVASIFGSRCTPAAPATRRARARCCS